MNSVSISSVLGQITALYHSFKLLIMSKIRFTGNIKKNTLSLIIQKYPYDANDIKLHTDAVEVAGQFLFSFFAYDIKNLIQNSVFPKLLNESLVITLNLVVHKYL